MNTVNGHVYSVKLWLGEDIYTDYYNEENYDFEEFDFDNTSDENETRYVEKAIHHILGNIDEIEEEFEEDEDLSLESIFDDEFSNCEEEW